MKRRLLLSGERANFTTVVFDDEEKTLEITGDYAAPYNVSWVEPVSSFDDIDTLIGLSEGNQEGLLFTFEVNEKEKTCKITSQQKTLGAPGHFVTTNDNSALVLATYLGGSIALYSIEKRSNGLVLKDFTRTEVFPEFPYKLKQHGSNKGRQWQCHPHQVLEDKRGLLYVPDLGSDRVWVLNRDMMRLQITGWLQCPPGTGPRHAVFSHDEKLMYVIGELSHTVVAFDLSAHPTAIVDPIEGFGPNVIPTNVRPDHRYMMDASEICTHPGVPHVLYVSNRWERHIKRREPHLTNVPEELPCGDAIAVILLSGDGRKVKEIKHVRTNLDVIRGMRLSDDGKYIAVVGQEGGGVEIYEIGGINADLWLLAAKLSADLEAGIKHAAWL